jgi:hypothetical protein
MTKKKKEQELSLEETKEISKLLKTQLRSTQIFGMVLYLIVWAIFSYVNSWSTIIAEYLLTGNLFIDLASLITFIVNIIFFMVLIGIFFLLPQLKTQQRSLIFYGLLGFLTSAIILGLKIYFNTLFSFMILMFNLPLVLILFLYTNKNIKLRFFARIFGFLLVFELGLILMDLGSLSLFLTFWSENQLGIMGFLVSQILLISIFLIEMKKSKKVRIIEINEFI